MTRYLKRAESVEARQVVSGKELDEITKWLNDNGYPWLRGDASRPATLRGPFGNTGEKGIYIDPKWGDLIFRTVGRKHRMSVGDWFVKNPDGEIEVYKDIAFQRLFVIDTNN